MSIENLTIEEVEYIHDIMLKKYGGIPGREKGKLEGVLAKPESGLLSSILHWRKRQLFIIAF